MISNEVMNTIAFCVMGTVIAGGTLACGAIYIKNWWKEYREERKDTTAAQKSEDRRVYERAGWVGLASDLRDELMERNAEVEKLKAEVNDLKRLLKASEDMRLGR